MANQLASINTAGTRSAALSATHFASTANRSHKRTTWPTATKSAFYANFYAVVEATGALAG